MKKILDSDDVTITSAYKSRNAKFRTLPPKINVTLPSFSPQMIYTEELYEMFGSLSALSMITDKHGYTMKTPEAPIKLNLDDWEINATIKTGHDRLYNVTCLSDEKIWTCGADPIMKLYNMQGKLLKSIQTKSRNIPRDVAVTGSGDLVYTDSDTRTVNIVKNEQIQEVIRLRGWRPYYVCSTSSGDLLVTMVSDDDNQSKVVRYSSFKQIQTIQFDSEGKPLYSSGGPQYISENRNMHICLADSKAGAVVVVNQIGRLQFKYSGLYNQGIISSMRHYNREPC
ncbi:uncharacterized protein LOC134232484 [Saccostrea cucullata]|uniref:uncharacterized protein LOC134232484 n=1 Tax=Saccostrea cuccullata TaxID=36930 RepID=UPI002ED3444F